MFEGVFVDGILKTKATDRSLTMYHTILLASNCSHVVSRLGQPQISPTGICCLRGISNSTTKGQSWLEMPGTMSIWQILHVQM